MKPCEEMRPQIGAYLDNELRGHELSDLTRHLKDCAACVGMLEDERRFLQAVRSARPLYTASPELRALAAGIIAGVQPKQTARSWGDRFRVFLERVTIVGPRNLWLSPQAAAAFVVILAVFAGVWMRLHHRPSDFAMVALNAHRQRIKGKLPLNVRSASPAIVAAWFHDKVPFQVKLPPNEEMPAGQRAPYQIDGGTLVPYRSGNSAYIGYHVRGRPVSLLVLPTPAVKITSPTKTVMRRLTIYYDTIDGFHVVTWAVPRGVTYAMVSDISENPNQACIVCHASPKERGFMQKLIKQ